MTELNSSVYNMIEGALSILPDSPFLFLQELSNNVAYQWLKWLNWFIPIQSFVAIFAAWCSAILVWYVIQIILRWAKAIE